MFRFRIRERVDARTVRQGAEAKRRRNLRERFHRPLTVEELAEAAHLSPRQFSRVFHAETGQSPAKAIENLRVEAARLMMERSRHPIDVVADQTGFADRNRMRRAFLRAFGQPPHPAQRPRERVGGSLNARSSTAWLTGGLPLSRRPFRDQPIDETRQHRGFANVEGDEGDIACSRDLDRRKRRHESPGHDVRLQDGQGADA
jgi:AraC-like DNA-binding protein